MPGCAGILRLPETFGRSSENYFRMIRILFQHARTARRKRDSLSLAEEIAAARALVNAGAGAQVHGRWLVRINDQREDVRIIDDAIFDLVPVVSTVFGFPREMPRAGIDDIWILGIDRKRFDVLNVLMTFG